MKRRNDNHSPDVIEPIEVYELKVGTNTVNPLYNVGVGPQ